MTNHEHTRQKARAQADRHYASNPESFQIPKDCRTGSAWATWYTKRWNELQEATQ